MGTAGDSVVNTISNNFGPQTGQITQQNLQQFASNPNQFVQTFPNQVSSGFSNQLGMIFSGKLLVKKSLLISAIESYGNIYFAGSHQTSQGIIKYSKMGNNL